MFVDKILTTRDVKLETTPTTPDFSEEEVEHRAITIPENVFKITDAVKTILPDYDSEDSLEELKDDILETIRTRNSRFSP